MQDCKNFETGLLKGIPYQFRYEAESILHSFNQSWSMLHFFSQAIRSQRLPTFGGGATPIIVAFGSVGRMDGSLFLSDYDVLYIYPGKASATSAKKVQKFIRELVSFNRGLRFDHRQQIEAGTFDFGSSNAYPIISDKEIKESKLEVRALQLLTEGRIVEGASQADLLRSALLEGLGHKDSGYSLNYNSLRDKLEKFRRKYCQDVYESLKTAAASQANKKILKLFALREFFHLATLFATAEIALRVSAGACPSSDACRILSAPPILKVASFSRDHDGPLTALFSKLGPNARKEAKKVLEAHIRKAAGKIQAKPFDSEEAALIGHLRGFTLHLLSKYSELVELLHDQEFMTVLEKQSSSVITWLGLPQFSRILTVRKELIDSASRLARILMEVVMVVQQNGKNDEGLNDAAKSLDLIANYEITLEAAT